MGQIFGDVPPEKLVHLTPKACILSEEAPIIAIAIRKKLQYPPRNDSTPSSLLLFRVYVKMMYQLLHIFRATDYTNCPVSLY